MYRMLFIARNNLVRKKSDVITLLMLIMLSTLLLYISISVLWRTPQVIDGVCEQVNAADFFYLTACPEPEKVSAVLRGMEGVEQIEYSEGVEMTTEYHTEGGEKKEATFLIKPIETAGELCRLPDIGDRKNNQTILLPYYMKTGEQLTEGDRFYLMLGNREYAFEVGGFVEDPFFATPLNVNVFLGYVAQERYEDILEAETKVRDMSVHTYQVKTDEKTDTQKFDAAVSTKLSREVPKLADYMNLGMEIETMKVGVAFMSNIGMGILLIFSVILIGIALIIMWCSIKNFIDGNLKNLGILMASGYTRRQLMGNTCMEMLLLSIFGAVLGIVAGGLLHPTIGTLMASLIGFRWNQSFDVVTALAIFVLVNLVILGVTIFSGRIYRKIEILDALRGGIKSHNFRKNPLPLVRCPLPTPIALGMKSILGEKRKNIAIMGVVALLGFACSMGFALLQNFGIDSSKLVEIMGVEMGTAILSGQNTEEAGKELETWSGIRKVLYYDSRSVKLSAGEKEIVLSCNFWRDPEQNENTALIEGRLPQHNNEICLTAVVAKRIGVRVGDVIYVEGDREKKDYMVTGIDQQMNSLGLRATMTMEGAERINGVSTVNMLYVYTQDDCTYEQIEKRLKAEFPSLDITDTQKSMETMLFSVKAAMTALCTVFTMITVVIVALVIILLVRSKTTREWKQYGVCKALGYTTRELVVQIQMSVLPVFLLGAVLGTAASVYLLNPLVQACLSMAGIVKSGLNVQLRWLILSVVIIMTVSAAVSFLCAYRVRHVEPVKMLTEE